MDRLTQLLIVLVGVPAVLVAYIALVEWVVQRLPPRRQPQVRPWLWIGPAVVLLTFYLVYPTLNTIYLSFLNAKSTAFLGLTNYVYAFTAPDVLITLRNNLLWLIFFTLFTVGFGLLMAVLTDRVSYESVAKALIFLPMAISFVAAGRDLEVHVRLPPARPAADRHAECHRLDRRRRAAALADPAAVEQLRADLCGRVDDGRLRHGHPLGRAQGHPGGSAGGGARGRRQRVATCSGASRCRCSTQPSPS